MTIYLIINDKLSPNGRMSSIKRKLKEIGTEYFTITVDALSKDMIKDIIKNSYEGFDSVVKRLQNSRLTGEPKIISREYREKEATYTFNEMLDYVYENRVQLFKYIMIYDTKTKYLTNSFMDGWHIRYESKKLKRFRNNMYRMALLEKCGLEMSNPGGLGINEDMEDDW